jgi:hypothetical protein
LVGAAVGVLFGGAEPSSLGERDASLLIEPGVFRDGLATAGGRPAPAGAPSIHAGVDRSSLLSGETILDAFRGAALEPGGWVWLYGDESARSQPFEPHADLDGEPFATWDDPILANSETFPEAEFYAPGDHSGCLCGFARDAEPAEGAE